MLSERINARMAHARDGLFGPSRLEQENAELRARCQALTARLAEQWGKNGDAMHAGYTLGSRDERGGYVWRIVIDGTPAIKTSAAYAETIFEIWCRIAANVVLERYEGEEWRVVRMGGNGHAE